MGVFQDIELEWQGEVFTIQSHRVMGAICRIEDFITLQEFQDYSQRGTAPLGKLCRAYGSVLRYAGARISDEDIYDQAFQGADKQNAITLAIMNLMTMMLPPHARKKLEDLMNDPKAAQAEVDKNSGNSKAAPSGSSKRRSKRWSRNRNG